MPVIVQNIALLSHDFSRKPLRIKVRVDVTTKNMTQFLAKLTLFSAELFLVKGLLKLRLVVKEERWPGAVGVNIGNTYFLELL